MPDRVQATTDPPVLVGGLPRLDLLVQLVKRIDLRHGDQVVAAEPPDRALDAALLMGALDAGLAVERVKAVVRPEQHPPVVLVAGTARSVDDGRDCGGEVVVLDVLRGDPADRVERLNMPLEERFLRLGGVHTVDRLPGVGEPQDEHVALGPHPAQDDPDLTEVDLGLLTRAVVLGDERLKAASALEVDLCPPDPHVVPHGRVRQTGRGLLVDEAIEDPGRGMPLLPRRVQIRAEHAVDGVLERVQPRCRPCRCLPWCRLR